MRPDIKGRPDGWRAENELDHFMVCPGCGKIFDMRDLGQALEHMHRDPAERLEENDKPKLS